MDRFPRRNTARHEWEDFEADDVWVFDPIDADVEMSVDGDDDTSSGDGESYDDASDDESMSSEDDDSNEDDDDDILERLEQDDPNLTKISLDQLDDDNIEVKWFPTTITEWSDMGDMLGNNTHVTDLNIVNDMDGESISMADERALYAGLQYNRSIEKLHFAGPLPAIFRFVNPSNKFWEANENLVRLSLNGLYDVGRNEMRQLCLVILAMKNLTDLAITYSIDEDEHYLFSMLLRTLRNMEDRSLKCLELQGSIIGAASMKNIVRTIQHSCPYLEELSLEDTSRYSCKATASLLRDPSSRLLHVDLRSCEMADDCALLLADALKHNTRLQVMRLEGNNITAEGWKAFSALICNKSSLMETVTSNHVLEDLGIFDEPLVDDLLALNQSDDKRAVAMNKAIKFHLSELVVTMGVKLLPTIMACIGADQKNACSEHLRCDLLASMFSIVRSTPVLFQYASHESDQDLAPDV
jgi:hypothetical protein